MPTDAESIVAAARASSGLHEFDSESFREGLELLARNFATNPTLNETGRHDLHARRRSFHVPLSMQGGSQIIEGR
jgi:hypothetical protein